MVAKLTRKSN